MSKMPKIAFTAAACALYVCLWPSAIANEYYHDAGLKNAIHFQMAAENPSLTNFCLLFPDMPDNLSPSGTQQDLMEVASMVTEHLDRKSRAELEGIEENGKSASLHIENAYPPSMVHIEAHAIAGYREWSMSHHFKMRPAPALT